MGAFAILNFFRLTDEGMRCGEDGLFLGAVPLLRRSPEPDGHDPWTTRPIDELNRDLSELYGMPIDAAAKREGLASAARALTSNDWALAKIAALLLRFPDPPSLAKGAPVRGSFELAVRLFDSGLLKAEFDPSKHPRTGKPPNRAWFADKEKEPQPGVDLKPAEPQGDPTPAEPKGEPQPTAPKDDPQPAEPKGEPRPTDPLGSKRALFSELKALLKTIALGVEVANFAIWAASETREMMQTFAEYWQLILAVAPELHPLQIEMRYVQQARASLDPPKTLVELQTRPTENRLGYELHHIVEQNPANLAKSPEEIQIEKFGRNLIDSPSNLAWIPRLRHQMITGYYNSIDDADPLRRIRRRVISEGDFDAQRAAGLEALRRFGVLK